MPSPTSHPSQDCRNVPRYSAWATATRSADLGKASSMCCRKAWPASNARRNRGERTVIELLYPGDILVPGLQAPLRDLALIAKRPVEFWRLTITSFAGESSRDSQLWQAIFLRLNAQNARSQLHIAATSGLNCEQRIAGFLIEIGSRLGVFNGGALSFELPMSRYSIAEYLSLNADTVSRTLSGLTAAKIIERRGRFQISILNWDALVEMCPLSDAIAKLHGAGKSSLNC